VGEAAPLVEVRIERLREVTALFDRVTRTGDKRWGEPVAGAVALQVVVAGGGLR
jgi:hypothetical protein